MIFNCNPVIWLFYTSTAGMDYNASSANFIFDGDPQEACIRINITNDDLTEQSESFLVIINTTITSQTVSLNPAYAFVTITDDEGKLAVGKTHILCYVPNLHKTKGGGGSPSTSATYNVTLTNGSNTIYVMR